MASLSWKGARACDEVGMCRALYSTGEGGHWQGDGRPIAALQSSRAASYVLVAHPTGKATNSELNGTSLHDKIFLYCCLLKLQFIIIKRKSSAAPAVHACNPSYLGWGVGQRRAEIWTPWLRPALANSSRDPISKITKAKWTGGEAQVVGHL
jgi:hypothetical protein